MGDRDRVLVVDDDVSFGGMVAETLADRGYDACFVEGPVEALERSQLDRFDAVLVDLLMPGMGGLELADKLRARDPELQVVVLTGHGDREAAIEAVQRGVFDFLDKADLPLARLHRSVAEAVSKSRLLRKNIELLTKLTESNRLLEALHSAGVVLAGEAHLDRLFDVLVGSAKRLASAECARALLFARTGGAELLIEHAAGDEASTLPGTRLAPGNGIAAVSAAGGEVISLARADAHPAYAERCDALPTDRSGYLCVPLSHGGGGPLGALVVAGHAQGFSEGEQSALAGLARMGAVAIENVLQRERADNFFTHVSDILVSSLESMDIFYRGHGRGVAALADMVTRRLGLETEERRNVHYAALLHDIGKLRLDPQLLLAKSISEESRSAIARHPTLAVELLRPISAWEGLLPIIQAHHERWDGRGYPTGLKGEEIALGARVVAVADAFDAMTRETPHGTRRSAAEALAELEAFSGSQFDPRIVRLFIAEYRQHGDPRPEAAGT